MTDPLPILRAFPHDRAPAREIFFKLDDTTSTTGSAVQLIAVDHKGERLAAGSILTIDNEGILLHGHVSHSFGLPLDAEGRVELRRAPRA